ncbi:hypothetical protein [Chryseobacterium sp. R2ACT005]
MVCTFFSSGERHYVIRWRQGTTGTWLPNAAGQNLPAGQSFYTIT